MKVEVHAAEMRPFEPVRLTIDLESAEELSAFTKMSFYSGSIPNAIRHDGKEYPPERKLTEPELDRVVRFLRLTRTQLRRAGEPI